MTSKIAEYVEADILASGIWPSIDKLKVPMWTQGSNVDFRKGGVQKAKGYGAIATCPLDINALAQANVQGQKRAYAGCTTGLYYYVDGQEFYPIRTGLSTGTWSLQPWGAYLLATNNVDRMQLWQNSGLSADISEAPLRSKIIRSMGVFNIALNTSNGEDRVEWADPDSPLVWTPSLDNNFAGGLNIRNISSGIRCAEAIGTRLGVWSSDQMYSVQYVGGDDVLGYDTLTAKVGAAGMNCVIIDGAYAVGVEQRGVWRTDGVSVEWPADPAIWDYFAGRIDFTRGDEINGWFDRDRQTYEWNWPLVGGGFEGWAMTRQGVWAPRSFSLSAVADDSVFGYPLGAQSSALRRLSYGVDAAGAALASSIRSKPLAMGETDKYKWVDEFRLRQTNTGARFRFGVYYDSPDGDEPDEWLSYQDMAQRMLQVDGEHREAAFWVFEISTDGVGETFTLEGIEVWGKYGGGVIGG